MDLRIDSQSYIDKCNIFYNCTNISERECNLSKIKQHKPNSKELSTLKKPGCIKMEKLCCHPMHVEHVSTLIFIDKIGSIRTTLGLSYDNV